jgi:hypothetical protein
VGGLQPGDAGQAEFVDEAALEGAIEPLAPAARLGRVGADVLDPQAGEGAADVREVVAIHGATGLGGVKGPAGAIGVQGDRQAPGADHVSQGAHHGLDGLGGPELRVEQPLGRVVDHGDQGRVLGGAEGEPGVRAAVQVQELPDAGARFSAPAVAAARPAFGDEARLLEGEPHEAVGQGHPVIAADEVVEVPHVEAAVGVAIEAQDALDLGHRGLAGRGELTAIIEADHVIGLIPGAPAAQAAGMQETAGRVLLLHPLRALDALQLATALVWSQGHGGTRHFVCLDQRLREAAQMEGFTVVPTAG